MKSKAGGSILDLGSAGPTGEPTRMVRQGSSWPLTLLAILAFLVAVHFAKPVLVPVVAAILLRIALEPVMSAARRLRVPAPLTAVLVLAVLCGGLGFGLVRLAEPATRWMNELPASLDRIEEKLDHLTGPLEKVSEVASRVETAADGNEPAPEPVQVEVAGRQSLFRRILSQASAGTIQVATILALLLLLLSADGAFVQKVVDLLGTRRDRGLVVRAVAEIEDQVARYLGTVILVNASFGLVIGIAFALVGMPNAALWGTLAALLSFVPYVGGMVGVVIVTWAAILTYDSLPAALVPPAIYLLVDACEGLVVTPMIMGRRFEMSPVVVFVWLTFWGWMWGIPGAFLAVPMLVVLHIVSERVPRLAAWSTFLGRSSAAPKPRMGA